MLDAWSGAIAVELAPHAAPRLLLERPDAMALAAALGAELARHLQSLEGLGLCWMGAAYDVAQLLRPGFPIWTELAQLYRAGRHAEDASGTVLTLCARRGQAPSAVLMPEASLAGGSLIYLPFVVLGEAAVLAHARDQLESRLLEAGLVDAGCARHLIAALHAPVVHARLLSRDDLCAITAANLEHAGLDSVWQVLEMALFLPERTRDVQGSDGLRWSVLDGVGHLHFSLAGDPHDSRTADRLLRARQALALLRAHAVDWRILPSRAAGTTLIEQDEAGFWIEWPQTTFSVRSITRVTREDGGLAWLELQGDDAQAMAWAVPLDPAGYRALRARLLEADPRLDEQQRTLPEPA